MTYQIPKALPLIAGIFAAILTPAEPIAPSAWAAKYLVVADGPRAGGRWDPALAPYVGPIIDLLGPDGSETFVGVRKSSQTGISAAAIALCGSYIDRAPCRIGYAVQTTDALAEFNREKLAPSIRLTPALRKKVYPIRSRSAAGSTEKTKRFAGGSLSLINGNSAADLKSRTLKIGIADEVDAWPDDLGDDGDPLDLFKGRFTSFHATHDWRLFVLSTPTIKDGSRIEAVFQAGDQRFWHVPCPQCRASIVLQFKHLKFERRPPYQAHYVAQCCGYPIQHHEKPSLVRAGEFVATNAAGTYPSFHVDALISQVETWDEIARAWWDAQGSETKLKVFYNTVLGLPYEVRGDAPDHVRLFERRGGYEPRKIPARALLLVGAADVQHNGIWYEVVGYAPNGESWSIAYDFLEGETTDAARGAFAKLAEVLQIKYADAFGGSRDVDALAIDAGDGGRSNQVLTWTRARPKTYAIKGAPGWGRPAIGAAAPVDITVENKKIAGGAVMRLVGTWDLKATWYQNLRKEGRRSGLEIDPPGYCHFHAGCDERYFRQLTSEYLGDAKIRGRNVKVWRETGPNHLLDCRIYAMAMAEMMGLSRFTDADWAELARRRGMSVDAIASDLFAAEPLRVVAAAEAPAAPAIPAPAAEAPAARADRGSANDRTSGWWGRR